MVEQKAVEAEQWQVQPQRVRSLAESTRERLVAWMGIASVFCGVISLFLFWVTPVRMVLAVIGLLLGVSGLVVGFRGGGRAKRQAVMGIVMSALAVLVYLFLPAVIQWPRF